MGLSAKHLDIDQVSAAKNQQILQKKRNLFFFAQKAFDFRAILWEFHTA